MLFLASATVKRRRRYALFRAADRDHAAEMAARAFELENADEGVGPVKVTHVSDEGVHGMIWETSGPA